ncbi:putative membrane protein [Flavobacterium nitrogenifigens]|uniref:Membrane protein n=2 Tax=Flavobacterium TaxID=237 RepID=A0ABR6QIE6_9FLAO|nr:MULTISPECIES: hypothetical protein [Flavobacterium]MBB4803866.1 putative membrane protein [Flavobacterium nitrogenifigens]MBB6388982.1 putative membrane protein [Flavobacterium notoginsengisoli]
MIKKVLTPATIAIFFWGIILLILNAKYYEYVRYYLYLSIIIVFPIMIVNMIKQRKNDKINGTKEFYQAINRMMIFAVILVIMFAITKQHHV